MTKSNSESGVVKPKLPAPAGTLLAQIRISMSAGPVFDRTGPDPKSTSRTNPVRCAIDKPTADSVCEPMSFSVEGWVLGEDRATAIESIAVHADGALVGRTRHLAERPDVCDALRLPAGTRTGFQIQCHFGQNPAPPEVLLEIMVVLAGESEARVIGRLKVKFAGIDLRQAGYGHVLDSSFLTVMHRDNVYGSGPSLAEGSPACLGLLRKYLGPPPVHLLDVGCGLGYYGRHLRASGYDWFGVEMKAGDCAELARQELPHQRIDGSSLPFADGAFDAVMCIEVMEHVEDLPRFLAETRRVSGRLVLSVPNFEPVPYLQALNAVPWHMLEADHKNFFTRWSLGNLLSQFYPTVEVTCYHEMPLCSQAGTPLYNSLFACAGP